MFGTTLMLQGRYSEAEGFLRHALRLNPRFVDARVNLGLTLAFWNRLRDAKSQLEKALKYEPRNAEALFGMALVAKTEGALTGQAPCSTGPCKSTQECRRPWPPRQVCAR